MQALGHMNAKKGTHKCIQNSDKLGRNYLFSVYINCENNAFNSPDNIDFLLKFPLRLISSLLRTKFV